MFYLQTMEDEMTARHTHLQSVLQVGNDLISAGNFGADKIQERIDEINEQWESLIDLAAFRKKRLNEAVDFYQVCHFWVAIEIGQIIVSKMLFKTSFPVVWERSGSVVESLTQYRGAAGSSLAIDTALCP